MAGLPKEELLGRFVFCFGQCPGGSYWGKEAYTVFQIYTLLFLDHFLNYLVVSFLQLNDFARTPQHQPKIINIKIKGGTYV